MQKFRVLLFCLFSFSLAKDSSVPQKQGAWLARSRSLSYFNRMRRREKFSHTNSDEEKVFPHFSCFVLLFIFSLCALCSRLGKFIFMNHLSRLRRRKSRKATTFLPRRLLAQVMGKTGGRGDFNKLQIQFESLTFVCTLVKDPSFPSAQWH